MAEYYGIFDYRQHEALYIATLVTGLRAGSRVKTAIGGGKVPVDLLLQAVQADRLGLLFWAQTEDGQKNRNRPKSFVEALTGEQPKKMKRFNSPEDFRRAWAKITGEEDA